MQVDFVVFLVLICSVLLPVSKPKWPIKYESFRVYLRLQKSKTCQAWGGGGVERRTCPMGSDWRAEGRQGK